MSHSLFHRKARYATAVSALGLMLCMPLEAAQSQRQPRQSQSTRLVPHGAAPNLFVHPATWDEQNVRMGWTIPTSPTSIVISRSVAGSPWKDIATVTKGQEYTDIGAAKLVPCSGTIDYRATAMYGPPPGAPQPLIPGVATAPPPAPGVSAPVAWKREMPTPVGTITYNSPGEGEVNLQWTDATRVHVFRNWQRVTSIAVSGSSVGERNVPTTKDAPNRPHVYHVAPACEVTGQGWVITPDDLGKHKWIYVHVK